MKPNTYTKLYAHLVFTPDGRQLAFKESLKTEVHKYIYGIIKGLDCYPVLINGTEDHVHVLTGFKPTLAISDLMRDIKRSSAIYINQKKIFPYGFKWQEGYGAFTVGYKELDIVYNYILNQEDHHKKTIFREEYFNLLNDNGVDYDENYLFKFYD